MYFIKLKEMQIAGTSPETMVKLTNRKLMTFPVAGTRRREKDREQDIALEKELLADEKECAEHNMLVDLARNDIGKIAAYGSVKVTDYMAVHRFSKVMHIASTVTGTLADDKTCSDTIEALLPAGTLSGHRNSGHVRLSTNWSQCREACTAEPLDILISAGIWTYALRFERQSKRQQSICSGRRRNCGGFHPENEYQECADKAGAVIDAIRCVGEGLK